METQILTRRLNVPLRPAFKLVELFPGDRLLDAKSRSGTRGKRGRSGLRLAIAQVVDADIAYQD